MHKIPQIPLNHAQIRWLRHNYAYIILQQKKYWLCLRFLNYSPVRILENCRMDYVYLIHAHYHIRNFRVFCACIEIRKRSPPPCLVVFAKFELFCTFVQNTCLEFSHAPAAGNARPAVLSICFWTTKGGGRFSKTTTLVRVNSSKQITGTQL